MGYGAVCRAESEHFARLPAKDNHGLGNLAVLSCLQRVSEVAQARRDVLKTRNRQGMNRRRQSTTFGAPMPVNR